MNSPADQPRAFEPDVKGRSRCELDQNIEILRRVPIYSSIPLEQLKLYAYLSKRMHYRAGEFVFRRGERGNLGYVIISGKAQVIRELKDSSIFLHEFREGDFFGGLALFSDAPRPLSVRAVVNLECLTVDRETFQKLFIQFPEVGIKMLDVMVRRFIKMEDQLMQAKADECAYG
jgi:CRP/FNR family transcriptional regulator, cyclic AMP receptor protein